MSRNFSAWPIYLVLGVISLPIAIMYGSLVVDSFTNTPPDSLVPNEFTLEHWQFLVDPGITGNVWGATAYTLIFTAVLAVLVLSLSTTGGYAISRLNLPHRRFFLAGIMVMHAFPAVTLIIGAFLVLQFAGLYGSLAGVIAIKAGMLLPLGIWIMKGFYDAVPWEIEMAGIQDGASRFTVWWRLVLPLVMPGMIALAIFCLIESWGEYVLPRVLAPTTNFPVLSVFLNDVNVPDSVDYNFNLFKSVGLYYTMPIMILFIFFQNRLMTMFGGGVKG
ncbi:carbohydrate ABC transporter permease [Consotaella aegiceratis]|uniref:carbohydrate ABC transporter permease n=1 Tax=Consotaella aegiceratis TaxID=3097961 RepID=UPI002F3E6496